MKTYKYAINIQIETDKDKDSVEMIFNSMLSNGGLGALSIKVYDNEIKRVKYTSNSPGKNSKYPFRTMKLRESLIFDKYTKKEMIKIANAARNWAAKSRDCKDYKFKARKTIDNKLILTRIK